MTGILKTGANYAAWAAVSFLGAAATISCAQVARRVVDMGVARFKAQTTQTTRPGRGQSQEEPKEGWITFGKNKAYAFLNVEFTKTDADSISMTTLVKETLRYLMLGVLVHTVAHKLGALAAHHPLVQKMITWMPASK